MKYRNYNVLLDDGTFRYWRSVRATTLIRALAAANSKLEIGVRVVEISEEEEDD